MRFEHYNLVEGRTGIGATRSIVQDNEGFMWFGGDNGLARYDGHNLKAYLNDPSDDSSISSTSIRKMMVDHRGVLWIATRFGINAYVPSSDNFEQFENEEGFGQLKGKDIISVMEGESNELYVVSDSDVLVFSENRKSYRPLISDEAILSNLADYAITSMLIDNNGFVWLGTQGWGLLRIDSKTQETMRIVHNESDPDSISHDDIRSLAQDQSGIIWVGTNGGGLNLLRPNGDVVRKHFDGKNGSEDEGKIIWDLLYDSKGIMWISVIDVGIALYDSGKEAFEFLKYSDFDPKSISSKVVPVIYEDSSSDIWLGTFPSGVDFWNRSSSSITAYYNVADDETSISHSMVISINEDIDGELWVGTQDGLNLFSRKTKTFKRFGHEKNNEFSLKANSVIDIESDRFGNLWIGTWSGGIHRFEKKSEKFYRYLPNSKSHGNITSAFIRDILFDSAGRLWVATETGGLNLYDYKTDSFKRVETVSSNKLKRDSEYNWSIYEENDGTIWLCSDEHLEVLEPGENTFKIYSEHESSLSTDVLVVEIFVDSNNMLWLTTKDVGIIRYDRSTGIAVQIMMNDGLPSNNILSIIEDEEGYIWLSTLNGIAKVSPETLVIENFNESNGVVGMQFTGGVFKDKEGKIHLASTEGLNIFQPTEMEHNDTSSRVVLTDFKIFNKSVPLTDRLSPLQTHINHTQSLKLENRHSLFTIEFSALSFRSSHKNKYSYMLENFDDDWIELNDGNSASYVNLPAGDYRFKLKGANADGVWSERNEILGITINPPFWATWWAYCFYLSVVSLIVYLACLLYLRRLAFQRQQEVNTELVRLDSLKSEFIANASHELITPLNGILGITESLRQLDPKNIEEKSFSLSLDKLHSSGIRLFQFVDSIMYFSKLSTGGMRPNLSSVNICQLASEVIDKMKPELGNKPISLVNNIPKDIPLVSLDKDLIFKVFVNLVDNSIKFTEQGKISFEASLDNNKVAVGVKDSGIGIDERRQRDIFSIQQEDGSQSRCYGGIGLGLAIAKQIISMHKSRIIIESKKRKGTFIHFSLEKSEVNIDSSDKVLIEGDQQNKDHSNIVDQAFFMPKDDDKIEGKPKKNDDAIVKEASMNIKDRTRNILIVDDDLVNLTVLGSLLEKHHYQVTQAIDGKSALDILSHKSFDLLIFDVMMPNMNGFELTEIVRQENPLEALPIVFLSASSSAEDIESGKRCGGNGYLTKPIQKDKLIPCIEKLIILSDLYKPEQHAPYG